MQKRIFMFCLLPALIFTGCSLFPQQITLKKPKETAVKKKIDGLSHHPVSLKVKDEREVDHHCVGRGAMGFASVTSKDKVSDWIGSCIASELESTGCRMRKDADTVVEVKIKDLYSSLWPFVLSSSLRLGVKVSSNGKTYYEGETEAGTAPFTLFYTSGAYEDGIENTLVEWKRENMPIIAAALEETVKKPEKPVVKPKLDPSIIILSPQEGSLFRENSCIVKFEVKNASGLKYLLLYVNGKYKSVEYDDATSAVKVSLQPGQNKIELKGKSHSGKDISEDRIVVYSPYAPADRLVVCIGISSFDNIPGSFKGKENAKEMSSMLSEAMPGEAQKNISLLSGKNAAQRDMYKAISRCIENTTKDNYTVIYYSGKVFSSERDFALAAVGTVPGKIMDGVTLKDVLRNLRKGYKGKHVLFMLDVADELSEKEAELIKNTLKNEEKFSILVVSGYGGIVKAVEIEADANKDGHVSISELAKHVKTHKGKIYVFGKIEPGFLLR